MDIKLFVKHGCPTCIPAKNLGKQIDNIIIINLDEDPKWISNLNLTSTPTLLADGKLYTGAGEIMNKLIELRENNVK